MVSFRTCPALVLGALMLVSPAFATRSHRAATSGHVHHHFLHHHKQMVRGQREIDPDRAREIQDALIRVHYMDGPASGEWDAATETAMQKYQADHGWQTKLTPDSRALISLGLGPKIDTVQATDNNAPLASTALTAADNSQSATVASNTLASAHSIQN